MSPILTRPVREQLEHDRVIRQLQARYKRKTQVIINPGNEQNQSITVGDLVVYPDALLLAEDGKRLLGTVEVETGESVNSIEARAEWGVYSKLRVPLHLYVPPQSVDAARRICDEYQIVVAELWSYSTQFDQVRFTLVHRLPDAPMAKVIIKITPKPVPVVPPVEKKPVVLAPDPVAPKAPTVVAKAKVKTTMPAKPAPKAPAKAAKPAKPAPKPAAKPAAKVKAKPAPKKAAKPASKPKASAKPKP
ncbi:MAG: hypothetical protein ACKOEC_13040, partial [Acidimicrobiia bacterium]